jgi:hypothetical protein
MFGGMQGGEMALDPSMRDQLIEARTKIAAQLDDIDFRVKSGTGWERRQGLCLPDYADVAANLQEQLREINSILDADGAERA